MPIKEHPVFISPNEDQLLWRYMSFPKFTSLLTTSSLWFANAEILAKDDPFEAILPYGNYKHRNWKGIGDIPADTVEKLNKTRYTSTNHPSKETIEIKIEKEKSIRDLRIKQAFQLRKQKFVNCWHMGYSESAAMWRIYAHDDHGVAIVSSLKRLRSALIENSENIYCGTVSYVDYEKEELDLGNAFTPIVHKRKSFDYEKEVRLVLSDSMASHNQIKTMLPDGSIGKISYPKTDSEIEQYEALPGKKISCNVGELVQEIRISPTSPAWVEHAVRDLCSKFHLNTNITRSNLYSDPIR